MDHGKWPAFSLGACRRSFGKGQVETLLKRRTLINGLHLERPKWVAYKFNTY